MKSHEKPTRFRTRYLIQPRFQLLFSGILILIALMAAALVGMITYLLIYSNNLAYVKYNIHTSPEFLNLLVKQGRVVVFAWITSFLVISGVLGIVGIFLSHRISGPIFAFMREMKKMKVGDLSAHLNLRKKDEFKELKIPFNRWVECFRKMAELDLEKLSTLIQELKPLISELERQRGKEEDVIQLKSILTSLEAVQEEKNQQLNKKINETL